MQHERGDYIENMSKQEITRNILSLAHSSQQDRGEKFNQPGFIVTEVVEGLTSRSCFAGIICHQGVTRSPSPGKKHTLPAKMFFLYA